MANLTKKEVKEIKNLIKEVESNQNFSIRNSEFYEPWDTSSETIESIADSCYYMLCDCLHLLKNLIEE